MPTSTGQSGNEEDPRQREMKKNAAKKDKKVTKGNSTTNQQKNKYEDPNQD